MQHDLSKQLRTEDRIRRNTAHAEGPLPEHAGTGEGGRDSLLGQRRRGERADGTGEGDAPTDAGSGEAGNELFLRRARVGGPHPTGEHASGGERAVGSAEVVGDDRDHRDVPFEEGGARKEERE